MSRGPGVPGPEWCRTPGANSPGPGESSAGILARVAKLREDRGMDLLRAVARPMLASSFVVDGVDTKKDM